MFKQRKHGPFPSLSWAWERGYSCSHLQLPIQQSHQQTLVCLLPVTEQLVLWLLTYNS